MNPPSDFLKPERDDPLQRALLAMRVEPEPAGPSAESMAATLAALRKASRNQHLASPGLKWKGRLLSRRNGIAASLLAVGGCAIWLLSVSLASPNVSYGAVADQIRRAHNMIWTEVPGQPAAASLGMSVKIFFSNPGRERAEYTWLPATVGGKLLPAGESVAITDTNAGQRLWFISSNKTAIRSPINADPSDIADDFISKFRKLPDGHSAPIADRHVGNIMAKGFKVTVGNATTSLWVDPKTGLPILAEMPCVFGGRSMNLLFDIQFDQPLDESLFSLDAPPGYVLVNPAEATAPEKK